MKVTKFYSHLKQNYAKGSTWRMDI